MKGGSYDSGIAYEVDTHNPKKLFEKSGYWAVGKSIGADMNSNDCSAYAVDDGVTPPYVEGDDSSSWRSRGMYVRKSLGAYGYSWDRSFRLKIEEWNRSNDLT